MTMTPGLAERAERVEQRPTSAGINSKHATARILNKRHSRVIPLATLKKGSTGSKIQQEPVDHELKAPGPPPPPMPNNNSGTTAEEAKAREGQAPSREHDVWSLDSWDPNYREKEYSVSCGRCVMM
ncbi:hypothetical protein ABEF95_017087 [Exophiala dermatitidis]